jgi:enterobactin synthetase component D / holo-[acyl-carrier protein] synthase
VGAARMLQELLPPAVSVVEEFHDEAKPLFPAEQAALGRAADRRRREFATGRSCAHRAIEVLGLSRSPILIGASGEPCWPKGVVGSITHCIHYRACAVVLTSEFRAIGIDAEPHVHLPERILSRVANPKEMSQLTELSQASPDIHWGRLLFSAKEAVYKSLFPLGKACSNFRHIDVRLGSLQGGFHAQISGCRHQQPFDVSGQWLTQNGIVATAVAISCSAVDE